jgi:hypothetical protein
LRQLQASSDDRPEGHFNLFLTGLCLGKNTISRAARGLAPSSNETHFIPLPLLERKLHIRSFRFPLKIKASALILERKKEGAERSFRHV